ncbi:MAG: UDP-N-acetylmuramate--L-alanine ligase [Verrucomicrobiota bacterium]
MRELLAQPGRRVHLLGVAGAGMTGLARLLVHLGLEVSGSDLRNTTATRQLEELGVKVYKGHEAAQAEGADLLVYSAAVRPENPERRYAEEHGILTAGRAECLSVLSEKKKSIVVAGMHGKTTSGSMLTYVLRVAGWRCSHYIGADVPLLGANATWDEGEHLVIEGDESDGTIQLYRPYASMLLNIEEEHLDFYRDISKIMEVFGRLVEQTSERVVYCADNVNAVLLCSHRPHAVGYGFSELATYQIIDTRSENFSSRFKLLKNGNLLGEITVNVPGIQNVSNSAGVAAMATELGVPWECIVEALGEFKGARRRFEVKTTGPDFMVVDDYAHHPTEVKATLAAARNSGWKRVIALFQPHRYSRTQALMDDFAPAFADCDLLFLTDIYAASETPLPDVSGEILADRVRQAGHAQVEFEADLRRLRRQVSRTIEPGDLVLTMGAGDIHQVATDLAKELSAYQELRHELRAESVLQRQEPMAKHTSFRVGGPADLWFEPADEEDLAKGLAYAHSHEIPVTLIGRGTNLLVLDGGIRGMCVHLGQPKFTETKVLDGERIYAGAGARLKQLCGAARKAGIAGLEFMEGIPGNVGGALRMNAGAMQGWTMEVVESIRSIDMLGTIHTTQAADLEVRYRSVPHFAEHIALGATFKGQPGDAADIAERVEGFSGKRKGSQPAASSAGCIFKNPEGTGAGKLIDELGLKNLNVGPARVSEVHANFIVNDGGATAAEVLELIAEVQRRVRQARDIELETEVVVLGEQA